MNSQTSWVLKVTKFCNLRCKYCYEWSELHKQDRFSLSHWERVLKNIVEYYNHKNSTYGTVDRVKFIWNGGEALLVWYKYIPDVYNFQRQIIGDNFRYRNSVQTNLYSLSDNLIDVLDRERFSIWVSFDAVPGVRLSESGKKTERKVIDNIAGLREADFRLGGICVLGRHNHRFLPEIFELFTVNKMPFRILKLRETDNVTEANSFALSRKETVAAFKTLFDLTLDSDHLVDIAPINGLIQAAIHPKYSLKISRYDRIKYGNSLFIVNTNGDLYIHREV